MKRNDRKAYAKINLSLDVLGKRDDGYHEIEMIMSEVSLYDTVIVGVSSKDEELTRDTNTYWNEFCVGNHQYVLGTNKEGIPLNEKNLVIKAAERFYEEPIVEKHFFDNNKTWIFIDKKIPMEAGLAGGSTDAATVLHLLNELFDANLSMEKLQEIGLKVGSDVPYCIMGGLAIARGRGERLEKLGVVNKNIKEDSKEVIKETSNEICDENHSEKCNVIKLNVVLVKTKQGASTKVIYDEIDSAENLQHPDTDRLVDLINKMNEVNSDGAALKEFCANLSNIFYPVTSSHIPKLKEIQASMAKSKGCLAALMTGTGPTMFALFENENDALACSEKLRKEFDDCEVFCCKTV